ETSIRLFEARSPREVRDENHPHKTVAGRRMLSEPARRRGLAKAAHRRQRRMDYRQAASAAAESLSPVDRRKKDCLTPGNSKKGMATAVPGWLAFRSRQEAQWQLLELP